MSILYKPDKNLPQGTTEIAENFYLHCNDIEPEQIVLPDGLKKIGSCAFFDCFIELKSVNIPLSVEEIGDEAFWALDDFESVTISPLIKKIGKHAFCNCRKLTITFLGSKEDIPDGWHKDWNPNCKIQYKENK